MKPPIHPGTIQLGEHIFQLPAFPENIEEILFLHDKPEDQYWRRQLDLPEEFFGYGPHTKVNADFTQWEEIEGQRTVVSLSKEDTRKVRIFRDRELKRREEGIWFMNKGIPTYMTGDHYNALQWCPMAGVKNPYDGGSKFGTFRWFQAKFMYFKQHYEQCAMALGGYTVKPKKTGVTLLVAVSQCNKSTMTPDMNLGAMSKSHDDCKIANMKYFKDALDAQPYIFLPSIETDNLDFIKFGIPRVKNTGTKKSQMRQMGNGKGLNTVFMAVPTKADAFDGPVMNDINLDELAKCADPYPQEIFEKTAQTLKLGGMLNGKLHITHYTPEVDGKPFSEARKIYFNSKLSTVDPMTQMTTSELFCYCISAKESYETPDNRFDKYGFLNEEKALAHIMNRREQLKGDRQKLQSFIRQYPLDENEAWREGGGGGSLFDNIRLGDRKSIILDALNHGNLPFREGNLQWIGEPYKFDPITQISSASEVRFIPLSDGDREHNKHASFRIYREKELIHPAFIDAGLNNIVLTNSRDEYGRFTPKSTTPFVGASDPTEYTLKSDVMQGSKNAMTVFNFPDMAQNTYHGKNCTGRMVMRYLHRPESPEEYFDDLVKMVFYFGCYIIIEANKRWVITKFKLLGLQNFLLVINKDRTIVPYSDMDHQTLPDTTKTAIDDYCRSFETYIEPVTGESTSGLDKIDDEEWLDQSMNFKSEDTKKFDLFVCAGYNIMAMNSFLAYRIKLQQQENEYNPANFGIIASKLLT